MEATAHVGVVFVRRLGRSMKLADFEVLGGMFLNV
jgi:hypothetical protein